MVAAAAAVVVQFIVALFFVYGLLFAKTQLQSYIILIGLVLLFLFAQYVQEPSERQDGVILGTAVILAIARTTAITLKLHDVVF